MLKLLSRCADVLALPHTTRLILDVTSGKSSSSSALASLIGSDPALSAGIIAAISSPYFGFAKKVSSVSHAVTVMGFQEVQHLVLSISVIRLFDQKGSDLTEKLWRHSFAVGVGSRMLAAHLKLKVESKYFVAGLLHDIGKIFLAQYLPDKFKEMHAILERSDNKTTYHALEEGFFGISHAEIGRKLLEFWCFPDDIKDAVAWHHEPSRALSCQALASCVSITDLICAIKGISPLGDRHFLTIDKNVLPLLSKLKKDFDTEDLFYLTRQLDLEIDRLSGFVSIYR
ncbi:MAG TPA: HDOD domain-containing protein [Deltaproteobacteria bacterium]|nr:HDOD domain-containing protein [Deltaproteobacteria bacterium]HQI01795.1 HDOD domain-containing protein [Deltaproteobacteria bacterium]